MSQVERRRGVSLWFFGLFLPHLFLDNESQATAAGSGRINLSAFFSVTAQFSPPARARRCQSRSNLDENL